jgi:transcriptional regulator with XRE-family HTH domain
MNAHELRSARVAAEISASLLAATARVNRTRLSQIECGYALPTEDERRRLNAALRQLIEAKRVLRETAAAIGWPLREVR